jgi:hypothetical protein
MTIHNPTIDLHDPNQGHNRRLGSISVRYWFLSFSLCLLCMDVWRGLGFIRTKKLFRTFYICQNSSNHNIHSTFSHSVTERVKKCHTVI